MPCSDLADLLLVVLDGQLEPAEVHALLQQAPLVHVILAGRVVEDHFQLPGIPSLREQVLGEHLALLGQLLVVVPEAEEADTHLQIAIRSRLRSGRATVGFLKKEISRRHAREEDGT